MFKNLIDVLYILAHVALGTIVGVLLASLPFGVADYMNHNQMGLAGVFLNTVGAYSEVETLQVGDSVVVNYFHNEIGEVTYNDKEQQLIVVTCNKNRELMNYGEFYTRYEGLWRKNEN